MGFGKRKQKGRKPDVRPMAAGAEICEARTLLSADGSGAVIDETVNQVVDDAVVIECESGQEDGFVPELAICEMLPQEVQDEDGEPVDGEEFLIEVTGFEEWNPEWAYAFMTTVVDDADGEIVVGEDEVFEGEVFEGEEYFEITTFEDFDPSWVYRGTVVEGEVAEGDAAVVEESVDGADVEITLLGWEDGLGCEVTADGFVQEGEEFILCAVDEGGEDGEGFETPVEVTAFIDEEYVDEEFIGEEVVDIEFTEKELAEGHDGVIVLGDPGEVIERVELPEDFADNVLQSRSVVAPNFRGGVSSEEPQFSVTTVFEESFSESSAVIGPIAEPSGQNPPTIAATSVLNPPAASAPAVSPPLAIPVIQSSLTTLFIDEEDFAEVGTLVSPAVELAESAVGSDLDSVASPLSSNFGSVSSPLEEASESISAELTPLLDGGDLEESAGTQTSEPEPFVDEADAPVSAQSESSQSASAVAFADSHNVPVVPVKVTRVKYNSGDIDRFMSDFAMNGFVI